MARVIVMTSGKGGVGKTTVTANLGVQLASKNLRVCLIDMDIGLNNLDVFASVEDLITFDLVDVLNGKCRIKQAFIESPLSSNLFILPCSHSLSNAEISGQKLKEAILSVDGLFDFIFIDCPAGIELSFHRAVTASEEAIIIVTPSIASIRDADKVISILKNYNLKSIKLIINKIRGDLVLNKDMYSAEEIESTLKIPLLGIIPYDDELLNGIIEVPSEAEKAFKIIARAINGKTEKCYDYLKKYNGFWGSIRKELKKLL